MNSRTLVLVLLAGLVALAGCSGGPANGTDTITDGTDTLDGESGTTDDTDAGSTGTVNFYVSDKPGALDDFRSLNVTISRVGFKRTGDAAGTNETNESDGGDGDWVEYEVDDRSVDLTRLVGDNATMLDSFAVGNGSYEKVFAYVSDVNGTLTDGSDQRVKLPSGKLQLNSQFTVGANESVDFVFDIQVHEAGKSGKYILKPVISESGTDKAIEEVDAEPEEERDDDEAKNGDDESMDDETTATETTPSETVTNETATNETA